MSAHNRCSAKKKPLQRAAFPICPRGCSPSLILMYVRPSGLTIYLTIYCGPQQSKTSHRVVTNSCRYTKAALMYRLIDTQALHTPLSLRLTALPAR